MSLIQIHHAMLAIAKCRPFLHKSCVTHQRLYRHHNLNKHRLATVNTVLIQIKYIHHTTVSKAACKSIYRPLVSCFKTFAAYSTMVTSTRRSCAMLPLWPVVASGFTNSNWLFDTPCLLRKVRTAWARFFASHSLLSASPVASL